MTLLKGETVRSGNNTARVKNLYANGLIVLMDINGTIQAGTTITGDDSEETITLSAFEISDAFDLYYDEGSINEYLDNLIVQDNGAFIAQDAHFTGKDSQNYQITNYIITEN